MNDNSTISLQDKYAPHNACFGCGSANSKGLRLKSYVSNHDLVIANWSGKTEYEAFEGILCGGIIGTLLDCHCNWSAAYFLMRHNLLDSPPCTVTAFYNVSLLKPTPSHDTLALSARLESIKTDRAIIRGELLSQGECCATCEGMFVAVKPGHPAYHRW